MFLIRAVPQIGTTFLINSFSRFFCYEIWIFNRLLFVHFPPKQVTFQILNFITANFFFVLDFLVLCIFFWHCLMKGSLQVDCTFFSASILIITGCMYQRCSWNQYWIASDQHLIRDYKQAFTSDTELPFYCFE